MLQATEEFTSVLPSDRNPLIDEVSSTETLTACADVVEFLGVALSGGESADCGNGVYVIMCAVESALRYEAVRALQAACGAETGAAADIPIT